MLLVPLLLLFPFFCWAAEINPSVRLDERSQWGFAESLFKQGEYYRAVSEYRRLVHYFPKGKLENRARLRIGESLVLGGEPAEAIDFLGGLLAEEPSPQMADSFRFLRGVAWLEQGARRPYPLRTKNIASALQDFRLVSPGSNYSRGIPGFLSAMEQPPELPGKSPWMAGLMSAVVPGAGSFYTGRFSEGALALFMNGLLIAGTVESVRQERPGLSLVLGTLAVAFYGGSIYSAANGAHKYNDRQKASYLTAQRQKFGIMIERDGLAAAFQEKF